jgi:citrate lyase subunit beta/citryl-CoA lyase
MPRNRSQSPSSAAGRRGADVRSDLHVEVELRGSGGIDMALASRVEPYYGDAIREQVAAILAGAGVEHARIAIDDQGALPFVIAARVGAALARAGVETAPPPPGRAPAPAPRDRRRRSRLYLPGNEPRYLINAGLHGPDGIILDLEDSVHPDEKDAARQLVSHALREVDFGAAERMVRINQLPLGLDDLQAVVPQRPGLILIPKVESAEQVREVDAAISRLAGSGGAGPWLMPILESALGVERAFDVARAAERVVALTLGLEDYAADLGVPKSETGEESLYARTRTVNAARAAGIQAIDSVYGQVDDVEGLRRWAAASRRLGFAGMGCLHPRQIRVIHEAWTPTAAEIDRALRIVEAFAAARRAGLGVVSLGPKMIDAPVIRQAERVVALAREAGLLGPGRTEDD